MRTRFTHIYSLTVKSGCIDFKMFESEFYEKFLIKSKLFCFKHVIIIEHLAINAIFGVINRKQQVLYLINYCSSSYWYANNILISKTL